jgi:hypothetical protein
MQATNTKETTITRAEYDRLRLADEPLPKATILIEPNGKRRDLILTTGQTVARSNPRIQAKNVRDAITLLADLTEAEDLGADENAVAWKIPLGNLIESGKAYQLKYDEKLLRLTRAALAQLDRWLKTKEAEKKEYKGRLFRDKAEGCVALLRANGF